MSNILQILQQVLSRYASAIRALSNPIYDMLMQYFHGLYQLKIKTSLEMFDKDFKVQLESKAREIKKVRIIT